MGPHGREGDDALHRVLAGGEVGHRGTGDPLEGVDPVDRLVHQGPSAVEGFGALPAARTVIGVVPPPGHVACGHGEPAKPASRRRGVHGLDDRVEPLREDRPERHAPLGGRRDHPVDPLERDLERLFADHRHALADRGERRIEVGSRGRGHGDEIGLLAADHRRRIGVPAAAKLSREAAALLLGPARGRHERDAGNVGQGPGMQPGDRTDADDGRSHRFAFSAAAPGLL